MKSKLLWLLILFFFLGIWLQSFCSEVKNIILIGWDGVQREHLKEMIKKNDVPNLMALCREGKLIDIDITDGATDTKAGWTQILTGYKAEITGVYNNSRYQPIPKGYSIFERLEKFFGDENIETIAIIGKSGHVDADPPKKIPYKRWERQQERIKQKSKVRANPKNLKGATVIEENGNKFVQIPGKPWYNAKSEMDLFVNGLIENEKVGKRVLEELEKRKDNRFFFFIHFAQPDHSGHKFGENSQQYTDGIKSDDEWTGKIVAKLKELGIYDKTLVYITADHGFNEGKTNHNNAPFVFLGTNDPGIVRNGNRMDITPTILKRFGVKLDSIEPKLDGMPLDLPLIDKMIKSKEKQN